MPPRRRRNGVTIPACTSSNAGRSLQGFAMDEGTSIHRAVSPFARRHPSSGLGRGERARGCPTPRTIAPATKGARSATRRARAKSFAKRASPSLERFGPRLASRKSRLAGLDAVTPRRPTQPASVGAGNSRARIGRLARVCPRVVSKVAEGRQASPRLKRSAYPVATGRVNVSLANGSERPRGEKASTTWVAVAKPRRSRRPEPGRPKGHRGAKVLVERKASRAARPLVPLHAAGGCRPRRRPSRQRARERKGPWRKARQGCQKRVRTHGEGKTTPRAMKRNRRCGPPKRVSLA